MGATGRASRWVIGDGMATWAYDPRVADVLFPIAMGLFFIGVAYRAYRAPSSGYGPVIGGLPLFDRVRSMLFGGAFGLLCLAVGVYRLLGG